MAKTVAKTDRKAGPKRQTTIPDEPEPTRAELYARARMRPIAGASRMTKDELMVALRTH
ncbi:MAG: hypothetical protein JWM77_2148 [Rhodospirillales bacterium]|jgi:hypothetical protein|nr:hypothetical protein [Rhodospirillales bacterium]